MKTICRFPIALSLLLLAGSLGCREAKKKAPEVASVAQDTMLLRDLAEANRNTAALAAVDNSLNTVRTSGDGSSPTADAAGQSQSPTTRLVPQPPLGPSQALTSTTRQARPNDSAAGTGNGRLADRSRPQASSGDLCDSPAPVDQRSCLNRSIVQNDADLNRIYQDVLVQSRKSGGPDLEDRFRQSQRDWVNTRDSDCQASGQGALWARARARCLADYSAKRTAELQRNLNSLRGQ
jgi:uncharacterized protein YecT (DUF1311 family)